MKKLIDVCGFEEGMVDYFLDVEESNGKIAFNGKDYKKGKTTFTDEAPPDLANAFHAVGGSTANVLHGISNLGGKAFYYGIIGDDKEGSFILDELIKNNIFFEVKLGGKTTKILSLITKDKERTFVTYKGSHYFLVNDIPEWAVERAKIFHISFYTFFPYYFKGDVIESMNIAKNSNTFISFDLGAPNLIYNDNDPASIKERKGLLLTILGEYANIAFANEEEAIALECALNYPLDYFVDVAIYKKGKAGALIKQTMFKDQPKEIRIDASPVSNIINTSGAGDGFAAGFLYALTYGHSLKEAGILGNYYASLVLQEPGSRLSYKPDLNLEKLLKSKNY